MKRACREPTTRPSNPKCAPEVTALFVPLYGPRSENGANGRQPTTRPTVIAVTELHQPSPNATGSHPSTMMPKHICAPIHT